MGFHADTLRAFAMTEGSPLYIAYCARVRDRAEARRKEGVVKDSVYSPSVKPNGAKRFTKLPWRVAAYFDTDADEEVFATRFRGLYRRFGDYYYFQYMDDAVLLHLSWM